MAVSTGLIVAIALWAADYFGDSRVAPVLQISAAGLLLVALENTGIVDFQKKMRFTLDFRFSFCKRIADSIATMTLALLLRSYWALVHRQSSRRRCQSRHKLPAASDAPAIHAGPLQDAVRGVAVDAAAQLRQLREFQFAGVDRRWPHGRNCHRRYALAQQISSMPSTELLAPLNRVVFPAIVRVKRDDTELKRVFLLAQAVQALIVMPLAVGMGRGRPRPAW